MCISRLNSSRHDGGRAAAQVGVVVADLVDVSSGGALGLESTLELSFCRSDESEEFQRRRVQNAVAVVAAVVGGWWCTGSRGGRAQSEIQFSRQPVACEPCPVFSSVRRVRPVLAAAAVASALRSSQVLWYPYPCRTHSPQERASSRDSRSASSRQESQFGTPERRRRPSNTTLNLFRHTVYFQNLRWRRTDGPGQKWRHAKDECDMVRFGREFYETTGVNCFSKAAKTSLFSGKPE